MSEEESTPLLQGSSETGMKSSPGSRKIHFFSCVSIALSMMTGVGIFIFPNMVLQGVDSGGGSLLVWTGAGIVALLAGVCYSELALALPGSGGELVYIQRVYGAAPANLFFLTSAFIKYPSIVVIMAHSSLRYLLQCQSIHIDNWMLILAGIIIVVVGGMVAGYSTKLCTFLISVLNFFKLVGIASIIAFAVFVAITSPDKGLIVDRLSLRDTTSNIPRILVSLFGAIASYEGWNSLNMVAGEVHRPQRTMPWSITVATCLAIFLYLACNIAYLTVLPLDVMKLSSAVAMDLGKLALGIYGEAFLTGCVISSCFATILAVTICNSRLLQRAAQDGQVPEVFKFTYIRTGTPLFAITLHVGLCCAFACVTSLKVLTTMAVIVSWVFYLLCFIAIFILRYRDKINPKFKVPILIPGILILFSVLLIIAPVLAGPGSYRTSFWVTLALLAILTPISIVITRPSLSKHNPFLHLSGRLTKRVEQSASFGL